MLPRRKLRRPVMLALYVIAFLVLAGTLTLLQAPALAWLVGLAIWVAVGPVIGVTGTIGVTLLSIVFVLPALMLAIKPLRRSIVSRRVLAIFRKILPEM